MSDDDIVRTLRAFLVNEFPRRGEELQAIAVDGSLVDLQLLDSIGMLSIVSFVERKWKIKLSQSEFVPESFATLERMRTLIERKLAR